MNALWHLLDSLGLPGAAVFVVGVLFFAVAGLVPVCAGVYLVYFLLSLPMRRNERTRLFLDCLGLGLKEGRPPEAALLEVASSRDRALGVRFHLLAAQLQKGLRLGDALARVPRLVPPSVVAMLKAGERIGEPLALAQARLRRLAEPFGDAVADVHLEHFGSIRQNRGDFRLELGAILEHARDFVVRQAHEIGNSGLGETGRAVKRPARVGRDVVSMRAGLVAGRDLGEIEVGVLARPRLGLFGLLPD